MKRKGLVIVAVLVAVVLIAVLVTPLFVNAERFRPTAEAKLSEALGRRVLIGRLKASLLAGGVSAEEVLIADDPAFSRSPFVQAKSIDIGVELWPLIRDRDLRIKSASLRAPQVALVQSPSGKWNFSTIGPKNKRPVSGGRPEVSVAVLRISSGRIAVSTPGGKRRNYDNVNLEAKNLSYTSAFPFSFDAIAPGAGKLKITGQAGPLDAADSSRTPFQADVEVRNLDLAQTGFVSPDSGIAGVLDCDAKLNSDGRIVRSEGTGKTQRLRLVKTGSAATQPVSFSYASDYDLERQAGALRRGEVRTGKSTAQLGGTFDNRGESPVVNMKFTAQKMAVPDIAGLLPAVGVSLPAGASLQNGTANADLALNGAVDRLVTTGNVDIDNVKVTGFSLAQQLSAAAALAGINQTPDTTIQTMSSNLRVAPEGIRADKLTLVVPELGTITGGGTVGADGSLNLRLVAKVNTGGGGVVGGLAQVAGLGGRGEKSIPFLVRGTTSKPIFVPDVGAAARRALGVPEGQQQLDKAGQGLGGILGGILGKKKPQQPPPK